MEIKLRKNLRPKVFHRVKLGNETQVLRPAFALVVFEIPQGPSERGKEHLARTVRKKERKGKHSHPFHKKCFFFIEHF